MNSKLRVKLSTYKSELAFESQAGLGAKDLYNQVCKLLGVHEYWYFGLMYMDSDNDEIWIDSSRKKLKQFSTILQKLNYHAKYMPVDVSDLIEDVTIHLFYLQVRANILQSKVYCPAETCALLASYNCQVRHGDYSDIIVTTLATERLLPDSVYKQHSMDRDVWQQQIVQLWRKHAGIAKEDAMMEYLRIAQDLDMYGMHYFDIENKKGTKLVLGIHARGLNIYQSDDKINPKIMFPWGEIKSLNFHGKRFFIKVTDKQATDFIFTCAVPKICKRILNLGIGYHMMYVSRQKGDRVEIPQLKATADQRKHARKEQRDKLLAEVRAREDAERDKLTQQATITRLTAQLAETAEQLATAHRTIEELRNKLTELQKAKDQLEQEQSQLHRMMVELEASQNLEAEERDRLRAEIEAKREEVARIRDEVEERDKETRRLQEEVEEARLAQEELTMRRKEEEELRARAEELRLQEEAKERARLDEEAALAAARMDDDPQLASVNKQLQSQLKELQDQLEKSRIDANETRFDQIHRENVAKGNDKYKTLKNIRQGNTVRRVDMFENM